MKISPRHRSGKSTHNCDHSTTELQMEYQLHHKVVKSEYPNVAVCYPAHNMDLETPSKKWMTNAMVVTAYQPALTSLFPTMSCRCPKSSVERMDDKCDGGYSFCSFAEMDFSRHAKRLNHQICQSCPTNPYLSVSHHEPQIFQTDNGAPHTLSLFRRNGF